MQQAALFWPGNGARVFDHSLWDARCRNPDAAAYIQAAEKLTSDEVVNFEQMACSKRA
jgi:hypothetical protein